MAAFQPRPRAFVQQQHPIDRPASPSSSLHFGDPASSSSRVGQPDGDEEWIVFKPSSPPPIITEDDEPTSSLLASGWTGHASESVLPMPEHDGSGRFSVPSPSLSASSAIGTHLETSMYASAPSHLHIPRRDRGTSGSSSQKAWSRGGGAPVGLTDDDDEVISLPSSISASWTGHEDESPGLRPATTSLEASSASRLRSSGTRPRSTSRTTSSISIVSVPTSPLFFALDGDENSPPVVERLTASALSTLPLARRGGASMDEDRVSFTSSAAARVVFTSDDDSSADELSRTPHAVSAGLAQFKMSKRATGQQQQHQRAGSDRRGKGSGVLTETTTSERVKRRHRRSGAGRLSEEGSTKRSATGKERHRVSTLPSPGLVLEEESTAKATDGGVGGAGGKKKKADWVTRVARRVLIVDEETVRMIIDSDDTPPATPRPRSHHHHHHLARAVGQHRRSARFSLGDSPLDLSGAYRPRYDSDGEASDDESAPSTTTMTDVPFSARDRLDSSSTFIARTSMTTITTGQHRSLSMSSIPAYLLGALLGVSTATDPSSPLNATGAEVRRTASVFWPVSSSTSTDEDVSGREGATGTAGAGGEEDGEASVVRSREEAIAVWRRWWRAWSSW